MDNTDFINWAKSLIDTHKKPIKGLDIVSNKSFLATKTEEEGALVTNHLNNVLDVCSRERVEKRSSRAVGNWLHEKKLVELTKVCGITNYFGFANKSGKYLNPEEAMFLLETNRLEIFWNEVPLSIQQAYEVIIGESIQKYFQYRRLSLAGFRLTSSSADPGEPSRKKFCRTEAGVNKPNRNLVLFQESGPKGCNPTEVTNNFDYKLYLPEHSSKGPEDFKFLISNSETIPSDICLNDGKTIIGYTNSEYSCFQFSRINLPDLD